MSVKKDSTGRRSVQAEVEVAGTAEVVWQAIATGRGVSSWFVSAEVEEREGGAVTAHFGPGMDSTATITAWEPPRRFAAESRDLGADAPLLTTEWTVEARSGGGCVVRVVHSLLASAGDWDAQLNSIESGWPTFFKILRLYLAHFAGEPCSRFQVMGSSPGPESKTWKDLTRSLGFGGATVGQRRAAGAGAPALAGVVEEIRQGKRPYALLRIDEPGPGVLFLNACAMGGQVFVTMGFYLYGDRAANTASRDEPLWHAWMATHFPVANDATG